MSFTKAMEQGDQYSIEQNLKLDKEIQITELLTGISFVYGDCFV